MGKPTDTELEVSRLITKLQWKLYSESGFKLRELGKIFKLSHQRIYQRLIKEGYKLRDPGKNKPTIPAWQKSYMLRLISYGATIKEANYIIGVSCNYGQIGKIKRSDSLAGRGKLPFKSALVNFVWSEFTALLIVKMWQDGATMNEIGDILGYSRNVLGSKMVRMRKKGINLTKRRTNKTK